MEDQHCLLERIFDGVEDPTDLSLALLRDITNDFSEERKIGQGGFGAVYKGILGERIVAVKRIHINENTFDDRLFRREFVSLWNTNHRNVVRFLGFCSNTYQKTIEDTGSGEIRFASILERLLCFEYIGNGSLDKHITDELRGLEWERRYEIITGICKGLRYLHKEKNIIHMDLKPANILLHHQDNKYMVPKITDFGMSRLNKNSHTVGTCFGTRGYMAPEYRDKRETTPACDIYSLGLIIIELVTGSTDIPDKNNVLRRWRHRWNTSPKQLQYQQVTRCIDIAVRCREQAPHGRPSILEIISFLSESKSTYGQISPLLDKDDMLGIKPLELRLPCELNKETERTTELTNGTSKRIAFNIQLPNPRRYSAQPVKGIILPESKYDVKITVQARDVHRRDHDDKFIVQSMKASENLTEEEITEHMFRPEAGKVVDEVDLVVVYEPVKPKENCKRRGDTNMPAEDDPEAKKGNILESASRKGKIILGSNENAEATSIDISSSARGEYTGQAEQCNLHTLQSFSRHYPTNRTYLGEDSPAVDQARGAMGSLLNKLGKLVTEDYSLDTGIKEDIQSFSESLMDMHQDLPKLQNVKGAKIFVDRIRELSYHIEDMVDSFLVPVEPYSNRSGFRELTDKGLKIWENGMMTHHQIGDMISDIKKQVHAVDERKKKYNLNVNNDVANAIDKDAIEDLRNLPMNIGIEKLIGIEAPRDEIIDLFEEDGNISKQNLKIVSIVGLGGLGKTTLAKAVYEKLTIENNYSRAFVPMGQKPVVKEVLKNIISAFEKDFNAENLQVWQLLEKLRNLLENKRYFIFIDDIWDPSNWESIRYAFPENKRRSRVITTTRNHDVALACCNPERKYVFWIKPLNKEDSKKLFFRITGHPENDYHDRLENISVDILKTCGGMPLAINSIASLLRGKEHTTWEYVWKSLGDLTEGKTGFESMKQILDLSYIHLPDHLKTCLLYVCKYREDWEIDKKDLLRQWVAEGFVHVSTNSRLDAEDEAEDYFNKLISLCLIQPGKIDYYSNEILSCRVHDIILDLMRSKSTEANFIHVVDGLKDVTEARGKIRRVSVQHNDKEDMRILDAMNKGSLSCVRSVFLCASQLVPSSFVLRFLEFKYVRVLELQQDGLSRLHRLDLTCISMLFLLRYLKIQFSGRSMKLPDQIAELQQLETLDLQGIIENYPSDIFSLPRLSHLSWYNCNAALPDGIGRLKSLRTLEDVMVDSVENIKALGELTNLRNLAISSCYHGESKEEISERGNALHCSISRISTSLKILKLDILPTLVGWSSTPFHPGSHIGKLDLSGCCFERCPEWIGQLHHLYSFSILVTEVGDVVSIVARLPSLVYFDLEIDSTNVEEEKEESVVISGSRGAFKALKHFIFQCPETSLTFEEGAFPKLEELAIWFTHHRYRRFLPAVGIEHLPAPTLKEVSIKVGADEDEVNWECNVVPAPSPGSLPPKTPSPQDSDDSDDEAECCDEEDRSSFQDDDDSDDYFDSQQFRDNLRKQRRTLSYLLKRAFKEHHPHANIYLFFERYGYDDEAECCNEEAVEGALMRMCLPRSLKLCQLTSVQLSTLMNILYTNGDLAVGSDGRQSGPTPVLESSQVPFPSSPPPYIQLTQPRLELSGQVQDLESSQLPYTSLSSSLHSADTAEIGAQPGP